MIFFCGVGELPTLVHGPSFSFLLLETQRGWWADEQNNLKLTPATPSGHLHEGFIFLLDLGHFFFLIFFGCGSCLELVITLSAKQWEGDS